MFYSHESMTTYPLTATVPGFYKAKLTRIVLTSRQHGVATVW